jgi:outer membrane murein-binding lipoprotein Lpp
MPEEQQPIPIEQLSVQQLNAIRQQLEAEMQQLHLALQQLKSAQERYLDANRSIDALAEGSPFPRIQFIP